MIKKMFLLAASLFISTNVFATTVLYENFENLVDKAQGIVIGTVANIEPFYDDNNMIYQYVTFADLEIVHGEYTENELVIRLDGGQVDGDIVEVHGSPKFAVGERVVLFLEGNGEYIVPTVGWTQGIFRINRDDKGTEFMTDDMGNRIFGINNNTVVKEQKREGNLTIINAADPNSIPSSFASGVSAGDTHGRITLGGVSDLGDDTVLISEELIQQNPSVVTGKQNLANQQGLSVDGFKGEIAKKAKKLGKKKAKIKNVVKDFKGSSRFKNDALPQGLQKAASGQADNKATASPAGLNTSMDASRAEPAPVLPKQFIETPLNIDEGNQ